jgi:hypothetical protein
MNDLTEIKWFDIYVNDDWERWGCRLGTSVQPCNDCWWKKSLGCCLIDNERDNGNEVKIDKQ